MKALCWYGKEDVRVETVPDPKILDARDAIVRITATAICGSDLHLYDGYMPTMEQGASAMRPWARCRGRERHHHAAPRRPGGGAVYDFVRYLLLLSAGPVRAVRYLEPERRGGPQGHGPLPAGLFGYSHMLGGFARGQAEYLRVPFADVGPLKTPSGLRDEQVLFPVLPHGPGAAAERGDRPRRHRGRLGVWPSRAIDHAECLDARRRAGDCHRPRPGTPAHGRNTREGRAHQLRAGRGLRPADGDGGRGPDRCIDAVGAEAHAGGSFDAVLDKVKAAVALGTDRPHVLREAIMCCRKGGTLSIPGVYMGFLDKIPFGAAMNKGLTMKMGQTHVPRYHQRLLHMIEAGDIDPSFVITHRLTLEDGPDAYKTFREKQDGCIKVVMTP